MWTTQTHVSSILRQTERLSDAELDIALLVIIGATLDNNTVSPINVITFFYNGTSLPEGEENPYHEFLSLPSLVQAIGSASYLEANSVLGSGGDKGNGQLFGASAFGSAEWDIGQGLAKDKEESFGRYLKAYRAFNSFLETAKGRPATSTPPTPTKPPVYPFPPPQFPIFPTYPIPVPTYTKFPPYPSPKPPSPPPTQAPAPPSPPGSFPTPAPPPPPQTTKAAKGHATSKAATPTYTFMPSPTWTFPAGPTIPTPSTTPRPLPPSPISFIDDPTADGVAAALLAFTPIQKSQIEAGRRVSFIQHSPADENPLTFSICLLELHFFFA